MPSEMDRRQNAHLDNTLADIHAWGKSNSERVMPEGSLPVASEGLPSVKPKSSGKFAKATIGKLVVSRYSSGHAWGR